MIKAVIITILVYSLILTIVDIIKDNSGYSVGLDAMDLIVAGPIMWVMLLVINVIGKPIYNKFFKNREKKKKIYSISEIEKTVTRMLKVYRKKHIKEDLDALWVVKQDVYLGSEVTSRIIRPSELKIGSMLFERLEKKYHTICYAYPDDVWNILCKIGISVDKSSLWDSFMQNSYPYECKKILEAGTIEIK